MKKMFKLLVIILTIIMLIPFTTVNATTTKLEKALEKLNLSETLKSINGTAKYEDDTIEIEYSIPNTSFSEISFSCEDNVIEYNPGEITNYEEAEEAVTHTLYATKLIYSALKVNGYTLDEIKTFFQSGYNNLDYSINGIEIKEIGEQKTFTGGQYDSTVIVTPVSIKIDVAKANLNTSDTENINIKNTTIEDVIENLKLDSDFITYKDEDGTIIYENEITYEDNCIVFGHTDYSYDYHNILFSCEDGVLIYEVDEITNYEEAEETSEHEMWALVLIQYALEANGYTSDQIKEFFQSENSKLDYEINGFEIKEMGEEKTFTGGQYDITMTVTPVSIKLDFEKANIEKVSKKYEVLEGANQIFDITKNNILTFRFNIEYNTFLQEGKIFIDNEEVSKDNYTVSNGSTIVTLNDNYARNLSSGTHIIVASVADGEVQTEFTVTKTNVSSNPQTGDNIMVYILILGLSIIGLVSTSIYIKRIFN